MSPHLSEDDLVLHHYGEGDDPARATAHLQECDACRRALRELEGVLALVPEATAPTRDAAWAGEAWARAKRSQASAAPASFAEAAAKRAAPRPVFPRRQVAWGGALAASLLLSFWLGRQFPAAPAAPVSRERILLVAVGQHLERSRMVLVELSNAPAQGATDIRGEQEWATSLVAENRLYRQAASRSGDTAVASLLDELERVLLEVAHGPSVLSTRQLEDLRLRIEERGLLFKVKVVEGQVRARARQTREPKEIS